MIVGMNYAVDPYGVLRDPAGRQLTFHLADRQAKYFLNQRYVPENYNGLLIGASETMGWHVPTIAGAKIYNESLQGANGAEERLIIGQAVAKGHFDLVVISLSPTITRESGFRDGLGTIKQTEVLGSIHSLANGIAYELAAAHFPRWSNQSSPNGTEDIFVPREPGLKPLEADYFAIDPIALKDLRLLAQSLKDQGARIVYMVPPIYKPEYDRHQAGYRDYVRTIRQALPPGPVINFNDPEYAGLTGDANNFYDTVHLKAPAVAKFAALLTELAPQALASDR